MRTLRVLSAGLGLDPRIGPSFLRAGLGYGGSCLPKDVAAFHWVAEQQGVNFQLLDEVHKINEHQNSSDHSHGKVDGEDLHPEARGFVVI